MSMMCGKFFLSLGFGCPCGAVGFPLRVESGEMRVVGCLSFGKVSFGSLQRVIEFQRSWVCVGGKGVFPPGVKGQKCVGFCHDTHAACRS